MITRAKRKLSKAARKTFLLVGKCTVIAAVCCILANYVFGFCYVRGNYMFPSIRDGDAIISYRLSPIVLNEVVVYLSSEDGMKRVGRVVAREGDTVNLSEDGELLVNGAVAAEEIFYQTLPVEGSTVELPYRVPQGEVFILNDYRSIDDTSAKDSRSFGSVPAENLQGKAWLLLRRRGF